MTSIDMMSLAIDVALKFHSSQLYGKMPYVYHLNCVAQSVQGYGDEYVTVAYLHDILEDTECTEEELREHFPQEIVDAVVAITKVKGECYADYIDKVCTNKIARIVKIHDTMCNLTESLKTSQWRRVRKYSDQLSDLSFFD